MAERGLLLRLSIADNDGPSRPVALYGGQLQDRAIGGVPAEGRIRIAHSPRRGHYADGTSYTLLAPTYAIVGRAFGPLPKGVRISPRVAPAVFGVGLLEAVPEATIVAHADPQDSNREGISGRPNRVIDVRSGVLALGRFGWKANVASVEEQNAGRSTATSASRPRCSPRRTAPTASGHARPRRTAASPRSTPRLRLHAHRGRRAVVLAAPIETPIKVRA